MSLKTGASAIIRRKTVQLEFPIDGTFATENVQDFPVICNGHEEGHVWAILWNASSDSDNNRNHFQLRLHGRDYSNIACDEGSYSVKITPKNYDGLFRNAVLVEQTLDLISPKYDSFEFRKVVTLPYSCDKVTVQITLQLPQGLSRYSRSCTNPAPVIQPTLSALKRLLDRGSFTDVVIRTSGRDFPCHKVMLASASPYFEEMFEKDTKEKKPGVVNWVEVFDANAVSHLLDYVYTGQSPPHLEATCEVLLEMADMCLMGDLKELCLRQLVKTISVDNMGHILRVTVEYKAKEFQKEVVNFIVENYDLKSGVAAPWEGLEPDLAKDLANTIMEAMVASKISL